MKTKILITLMVLFIMVLPSVYSFGIGISPSKIDIKDAIKLGEYTKAIRISALSEEDIRVSLETSGDISSWISFYENDNLEEKITSVDVPADDNIFIIGVFRVPEDAANGNYGGRITVKNIGEDDLDVET